MLPILNNVTLNYNTLNIYKNFNLSLEDKKILCIVGPSGCGKSSLLHIIAGLLPPTSGTVSNTYPKVGYIFQEDRLLPWESVYENVALVSDCPDKAEILNILSQVELSGFEDKLPHELSGGMRQRCSLARGFYYNAPLLLMDEPFKSLDHDLRLSLLKYLIRLWEHNQNTIVFVTHDIDEALLLGHKIIVLSKRPTSIVDTFDISTPHANRSLVNEEHNILRNKIISKMTYTKERT